MSTGRWASGPATRSEERPQDRPLVRVENGANVAEKIDLSVNGSRLRLTQDAANIVMDVNGAENFTFNALGGADTITVNDLSGADVKKVNLNLDAPPGSGTGDRAVDTVIVNGTAGDDVVPVAGGPGAVTAFGLSAQIKIAGAEPTDQLAVNIGAGDDVVQASALGAGAVSVSINGGDGDDVLIGGAGNDGITDGAGDDVLIGGPGQDVLDGGPGNNIVIQD